MKVIWIGAVKILGFQRAFETKEQAEEFLEEDPEMHWIQQIPLEEKEVAQ